MVDSNWPQVMIVKYVINVFHFFSGGISTVLQSQPQAKIET